MNFTLRFLRGAASVVLLAVVVLAIFTAGAYVGIREPQALPDVLRERVIDAEGPSAVSEAFGIIREQYYEEPGQAELRDNAIDGMVEGLDDRFSTYFDPKAYAQFQQSQDNRFDGIGVVINEDPKGLKVVRVYAKSPAKEAGIKADDVITAADGVSLKGMSATRASGKVRGPAGTKVKLQVERRVDGKTTSRTIDTERRPVEVPIVASTLRTEGDEKVGVVRLAQFTNGATLQVGQALARLEKRGAKRFVLDLRSNPGGLVNEAQGVASLFLEGGDVVTLKGRTIGEQSYPATDKPVFPKQPLVVVVNQGSASASEIVTGAVQDRDRATVVGERTYGKGVFQRVVPLSSGGALDITAGQYFTPKGRNLGGSGTTVGKGLQPDVKVKDDPDSGRDVVLERAVKVAAKAKAPR
ncbi:MAG: S41 family peptidase [Patulibacter sp.]